MIIFKIFPKSRKRLIESLEFSDFLFEALFHLKTKYPISKNKLIRSTLKLFDWWLAQQYNQVKDYQQLLNDYLFWESHHYYFEHMQKFVAYELSNIVFVTQVLYPSLSITKNPWHLQEGFRRQVNIEFDLKSFGFSKIILNLIFILEEFDKNSEKSFFTEEEFREIIQTSLIKIEKYVNK
jgi:hypothetical protein